MDAFDYKLNELLVEVFKSILKVEEEMIRHNPKIPLTISELHLLEAVGKNKHEGLTISKISDELDISPSSVTIAVNKLIKKGFLIKKKNESDGRSVIIFLTKDGLKVDRVHQHFHRKMVSSIAKDLNNEEKNAMIKGIEKLNIFFKQKEIKAEE